MKILNVLKTIKEYQVSILIAFIIVSILYGIHMFRYEYIDVSYSTSSWSGDNADRRISILRVDRITNDVCHYVYGDYYVLIYRGDKLEMCDL